MFSIFLSSFIVIILNTYQPQQTLQDIHNNDLQ